MPLSNFAKECKALFSTTNLYSILGMVPEDAKKFTEKDIKRAYYKASLKYHPDRVQNDNLMDDDEVQLSTKRFQLLGKVYKILSDSDSKKYYDQTGEVDDEDRSDDRFDWSNYWRSLFKQVTIEDIENFYKTYKGSQEEVDDLKTQYLEYGGDMKELYERAIGVDAEEDRDRVRGILQKLIDDGEVEHFEKFDHKETATQKKRRMRKREKEAAEAEEMWKEITGETKGKVDNGDEELRNAIMKRNSQRTTSLLQQLEDKYGGPSASKKKKAPAKKRKAKGAAAFDDDDE